MAGDQSSKDSSAHRLPPLPTKQRPRVQKNRSMTDILKTANYAVVNYRDDADITCIECGSGGKNQQVILCAKCNQAYHRHCLRLMVRDPAAPWYCPSCPDLPPPHKSTNVEESSKGKATAD
ncbi:hypothetical protein LXL04_019495 [Taraxacum kok-saghyz]